MTTNQLLKKMESFLFFNKDILNKEFAAYPSLQFSDTFAKYAMPLRYKINKKKTYDKMLIQLKNIMNNGFIEENLSGESDRLIRQFLITESGYKRLQASKDARQAELKKRLNDVLFSAIGAAIGTTVTLVVTLLI